MISYKARTFSLYSANGALRIGAGGNLTHCKNVKDTIKAIDLIKDLPNFIIEE